MRKRWFTSEAAAHDCKDEIEMLRYRWLTFEQLSIEKFNTDNPTRPVSRTTLDALPDSFVDFWGPQHLSKNLLDGSVLRAAEWCEIVGFDPWWHRLERRRQAVVSEHGTAQPLWWLFNMARSDQAVHTMPLLKRCVTEFTPAIEDEPLPAFTSTIIFTHYRLRLPVRP